MKLQRVPNLNSILVVEDDEDHARLIVASLRKNFNSNKEIIWLDNGEKAICFLANLYQQKCNIQEMPSIVLLDNKLPLKNGLEVLAFIKQNDYLKTIPVVMISTSSNPLEIVKAIQLGANDYICKPSDYDDFQMKIVEIAYYWDMISNANLRC